MKYVASEVVSSEGSVANKGNIDWNDFNYPCLIKIYHYNPDETPEIHRRRVTLLRINHTLVIFATFLNIIANIAGAAQGYLYCNLEFLWEESDWQSAFSYFSFGYLWPSSFYSFLTTSS